MDASYRWDDTTYEAIAANHVAWQDVSYVLRHARPKIRRHIGSVLHIAAYPADRRIILVTLIEETDDDYLVVTARYLTGDEHTHAEALLNRGP